MCVCVSELLMAHGHKAALAKTEGFGHPRATRAENLRGLSFHIGCLQSLGLYLRGFYTPTLVTEIDTGGKNCFWELIR